MCQSHARDFEPGDARISNFGWRECFIVSPTELHAARREVQPFSVYLGALGVAEMASLCRSLGRNERDPKQVLPHPRSVNKPAGRKKGVMDGDFSKA
jgi:hypothetical protein